VSLKRQAVQRDKAHEPPVAVNDRQIVNLIVLTDQEEQPASLQVFREAEALELVYRSPRRAVRRAG